MYCISPPPSRKASVCSTIDEEVSEEGFFFAVGLDAITELYLAYRLSIVHRMDHINKLIGARGFVARIRACWLVEN